MIGVPTFQTNLWGGIPEKLSEFRNSCSNRLLSATPSRLSVERYSFVSPVRRAATISLILRTLALVGARIARSTKYSLGKSSALIPGYTASIKALTLRVRLSSSVSSTSGGTLSESGAASCTKRSKSRLLWSSTLGSNLKFGNGSVSSSSLLSLTLSASSSLGSLGTGGTSSGSGKTHIS
ncbi:hypothetical protein PHMEG_00018182 [Phytophthora megakarya]|uniref:Uncharacterized protein n=1 Tax=Phytophthora megakarya TaxID=4795 RepID=A0A225VUN8_9STRA|nr:hypothetical protein PHMEG_00018182 [Phytophthora megakarya]